MISTNGPTPDTGTTLALFVPHLLHSPPAPPDPGAMRLMRAEVLELILARADRLPGALPDSPEAARFALFGIEAPVDQDLPVAAVTRLADLQTTDTGWWIRADPVSLEPHGDGLVLHAGEEIELSGAEAAALAAPLQRDCEAAGWRLEAPHPLRWYLQPPRPPADLKTTALRALAGRDIGAGFPAGRDGGIWRRRLSEFQLLLHASPVNEARQRLGLRPINSLWFWGGGGLPHRRTGCWSALWANEELGSGLAQLCNTDVHSLPADLRQWRSQASPGRHLVMLDDPGLATVDRGGDRLRRIEQLEHSWFRPAVELLRNRGLGSFTLYVEGQPAFRATHEALRRWWRRRHALGAQRAPRDNGNS